jgi:hypothetical protein
MKQIFWEDDESVNAGCRHSLLATTESRTLVAGVARHAADSLDKERSDYVVGRSLVRDEVILEVNFNL